MSVEERIREALVSAARDRGRHVPDWPEDERDLYREVSCRSFMEAQDAVFNLRVDKVASVVAGIVRGAQAEAFEQGQKSGIRHADRVIAAAKMGRPELPGPPSPNPYRGEGATP